MKFHYSIFLAALLFALQPLRGADFVAAGGRIIPGEGAITVAASTLEGIPPIVDELYIKKGDKVEPGQQLATLIVGKNLTESVNAADSDVKAAEVAVAVPRARITQLKSQLEQFPLKENTIKAAVRVAQQQLAEAQTAEAQAVADMRRQLAAHDAGVDKLERQKASYQKIITDEDPPKSDRVELRHQQRLLDAEIISLKAQRPALAEALRAAIDRAAAASLTAEAEVVRAHSSVNALDADRIALQESIIVAEAELAKAEAAIRVAEAAVQRSQALAELATIRAPMGGTILEVNANPGELVDPSGLCQIMDTTEMFVEAEVYIDDIRHIAVGQKVDITSHAFEGALSGTVDSIGAQVETARSYTEDPAAFTDRRVVIVRVLIDEPKRVRNLIYAQVNARIHTGQ